MDIVSNPWKDKKDTPVVGIVAEYNPFHNGHAYQIQEAKRLSGAKHCIVVMSGDFVQRGAPAIFDKYTRTEMALLGGADLVIEIPPMFAVSSAEDFAGCAVSLLDHLKIVSHLCFGCECGDTGPLMKAAQILCEEPEVFRTVLREGLKTGLSFPQARMKALKSLSLGSDYSEILSENVLSAPNNILGVEYCKALIWRESSIIPFTIKRRGNDYHDTLLSSCEMDKAETCFSSASALRKALEDFYGSSDCSSWKLEPLLRKNVPESVWELANEYAPVFPDDFSALLSCRLLELQSQNADLTDFEDVSEELAARMKHRILDFSTYENRIEGLKTKQYTYTRVSRSLVHILLNITREEIMFRKGHDYISCFRVLGFKRDSASLLTAIKKATRLPLITKTADAANFLDEEALKEFYRDLLCSHVYQSVAGLKKGNRKTNEYTQPVIIL